MLGAPRSRNTHRPPMAKPTKAQISAMRMIHKRDWPAGEPRLGWFHKATAAVLLRNSWIVARPYPGDHRSGPIVELTNGGRAVMIDG